MTYPQGVDGSKGSHCGGREEAAGAAARKEYAGLKFRRS